MSLKISLWRKILKSMKIGFKKYFWRKMQMKNISRKLSYTKTVKSSPSKRLPSPSSPGFWLMAAAKMAKEQKKAPSGWDSGTGGTGGGGFLPQKLRRHFLRILGRVLRRLLQWIQRWSGWILGFTKAGKYSWDGNL